MTEPDVEHTDDEEPAIEETQSDDIPASGVTAADEATARLRDLDDAPLSDHVEIYEDVHQRLHDGLADLDDRTP